MKKSNIQISNKQMLGKIIVAILFLFILPMFQQISIAQGFTQTIKGRIIAQQTKSPLLRATILIESFFPQNGTKSDVDGYFKINGIITGRVNIKISYMGYHSIFLNNLSLSSG